MSRRLYATRSNARRAAEAACRRALNAPHYRAAEGCDYGIHPVFPTVDDVLAGIYNDRFWFELRGPAAEALQQHEEETR